MLLPWTGDLSLIPGSADPEFGTSFEFSQGGHNPEYPGTPRRFAYVEPDILDDPLLRRLILFDLAHVPWRGQFAHSPIHVGVHLVKLSVTEPHTEAVSSPNCLHQDGDTLATYFVHLLARDNVEGGINTIAAPECAGLSVNEVPVPLVAAQFTLEEPLDSYAVNDQRVSHYVSPIRRGPQPRPGARAAILIGLVPFVQHPWVQASRQGFAPEG